MSNNNTLSFYFLLIFLFVNTNWGLASNGNNNLTPKERSAKINEYLTIANQKQRADTEKSIEAAQNAQRLSLKFDQNKYIASTLIIAKAYQQSGNIDTALILTKEALIQAKALKNDTLQAEAYHTLGLNYQFKGSSELAIESYHHALKINESLGLYETSMKQLNNIGLLYREEEEYDLAIQYLEKCLHISRENGYKKSEFFSYGNIGYVLMKQNKWAEALQRFEKTLALSDHVNDTIGFCTIHYLIADVKLNQKDYPAAKVYAHKGLKLANYVDYAIGKTFCKRVLSEVYFKEKKYGQARATIFETLDYIKNKSVNLYLEDVLNVWYKIEYETGNYKDALEIQNRIYTRKDSLNQIKTKEKISNSEYKYQLLQNEQENQLLKIQNDNSNRTSIFAITIALLLLLLVFLSFFAYRKSRDINETLEKAIKIRTEELESSNLDLAKSNEELERFAFIASHDLKTPLRDIVSFAGLLERQLQSYDDKKVHEYLSFIKKGGIRLNTIIMDTLEYSRLSYLKQEDQTVNIDLNKILVEIQNSLTNYIKEKNAKVNILNTLPVIKANHSAITLLFQNLIQNSINYNQSDIPTIKIYTTHHADFLSVFVEDNGIGIPKEYQDEIFVMFSRLHTKNEYEGSGLGLAICKKIIDHLNGEILIESEIDKGSIFEIRIPSDLIEIENPELIENVINGV